MSVSDDQQFCLRWNNFQAYITSQFEALRDDEDFVDVTLACEGQRLGAHKVVLSACSPFFKELFKTNPCPHPIIFMRDVEIRHVVALLEFMYAGEVNVAQAQLPGFLKTAESLQIRGLTDASKNQKEDNEQLNTESEPTSTLITQNATSSSRSSPVRTIPVKSKQFTSQSKSQNSPSPSRAVTSTQERPNEESLLSPPPCKKLCNKTDSESDGPEKESDITEIDPSEEIKSYQINPFAIQTNNKALQSEIDISTDLIEPKLELPDYSEDDTNQENPHSFLDSSEMQNSFTSLPSGMEIIPGTSSMGDITQDNQQAWDNRKLHSLDPRPCPVCGRVYSNLSNLRQHMRLIHNPTHVECPVCSKPFKTTLYLKRHLVSCRVNHAQSAQQPRTIITQPINNENQTYLTTTTTTTAYNGTNNEDCFQQNDSLSMLNTTFDIKNEVANDNIAA